MELRVVVHLDNEWFTRGRNARVMLALEEAMKRLGGFYHPADCKIMDGNGNSVGTMEVTRGPFPMVNIPGSFEGAE